MKKFLIPVLSLASIILVGCGSNNEEKDDIKDDVVTTSYQLLSTYDELKTSFGFNFEFLVNLQSDGTGTIYQLSQSLRTKETTKEETTLAWKIETDEDNISTMTLAISGTKYEGYQSNDGSYSISDYTFTFMGSYTRKTTLKGSSTITYSSVSAWQEEKDSEAYATDWVDPSEGDDEDDNNKETEYEQYTIYFDYVADASSQLSTRFYATVATWGASLGSTGTYTPVTLGEGEEKEELFQFTSESDATNLLMSIYNDGTSQFTYVTYNLKESGTWTWSGFTFTYTTAGGQVFNGTLVTQ